uniref:IncF plasmid conjugative transfer protein TraN n=1 Tax=Klebsiella pneumoniae TaxID=573 RepID=A0A8B0SSQ8_KLEPN|nr:IncF plasmid conjugative transfer protein TraN [Klebsiella pneumoniae]
MKCHLLYGSGGNGEGYFEVELIFLKNIKLEDKHIQDPLAATMLLNKQVHFCRFDRFCRS